MKCKLCESTICEHSRIYIGYPGVTTESNLSAPNFTRENQRDSNYSSCRVAAKFKQSFNKAIPGRNLAKRKRVLCEHFAGNDERAASSAKIDLFAQSWTTHVKYHRISFGTEMHRRRWRCVASPPLHTLLKETSCPLFSPLPVAARSNTPTYTWGGGI